LHLPGSRTCQSYSLFRFLLVMVFTISLACELAAFGQVADRDSAPNSLLEHYDLAHGAQKAGDPQHARFEYEMFLAEALHRLANGRANAKDFAQASSWYADAIHLKPHDATLCLDYASAALASGDLIVAKRVARLAVEDNPRSAPARLLLGQILLRLHENKDAKSHLEIATAMDPTFDAGYALATADLALEDEHGAATLFDELIAGFGDTAVVHMKIGRAYALAGYQDEAIPQFQKAVAEDDHFSGAHYSLGAAYMESAGAVSYPKAVQEFRAELQVNPDDFLSHLELGFIAKSQHDYPEAEKQLIRAKTLNPTYPHSYLYLGQLYSEMKRWSEAEAALRQAILLTLDDSTNHYQIQSAHYLLGRILLQSGRKEEGSQEINTAQKLQQLGDLASQRELQDHATGGMGTSLSVEPVDTGATAATVDPQALRTVKAVEKEIGPGIADSYNNLGALAAESADFPSALDSFAKASAWNPKLEGLDSNWGKAAFTAKHYDQAIAPLTRQLESHPNDKWTRTALGMSYFVLARYGEALRTWEPVEAQLNLTPQLAYAYAVSMSKAGDYTKALELLKHLEQTDGGVIAVHLALGDAYEGHRAFEDASAEFREALRLGPTNVYAKLHLAHCLSELQRWDESRTLLTELINSGSNNADVYYELGKLQMARGEARNAIANLEIARQLSPASKPIHRELAAAYRKDSRMQDAEREARLAGAVQGEHVADAPSSPH
jgi:tetratricopeptide (TPR) repeat protein